MDPLIAISDLWVEVGGKSTLLSAIMGLPGYRITRGTIAFRGKRIDGLASNADGRIACSGNPHEMFEAIRKEGYEHCVQCLATRPGEMP
jgi:Fe-S cluster assembly ATPase SufC